MAAIAVHVNPYILEKKFLFSVGINKKVTHSRVSVSTQRGVLVYAERFVDKDVRAKPFPLENLQKENVSC